MAEMTAKNLTPGQAYEALLREPGTVLIKVNSDGDQIRYALWLVLPSPRMGNDRGGRGLICYSNIGMPGVFWR